MMSVNALESLSRPCGNNDNTKTLAKESEQSLDTDYIESSCQSCQPEAPLVLKDGLPVRPGVKQCNWYKKTGKCTYGVDCKWDHSEPSPIASFGHWAKKDVPRSAGPLSHGAKPA